VDKLNKENNCEAYEQQIPLLVKVCRHHDISITDSYLNRVGRVLDRFLHNG